MANFSNYGADSVDLAASGVGILSTLPGNTHGSYSGTSMAMPHVTRTVELRFLRDGALLTTKTLELPGSRYSCSYGSSAPGVYTVRAEYAGDGEHAGDTSPSRTSKVVG